MALYLDPLNSKYMLKRAVLLVRLRMPDLCLIQLETLKQFLSSPSNAKSSNKARFAKGSQSTDIFQMLHRAATAQIEARQRLDMQRKQREDMRKHSSKPKDRANLFPEGSHTSRRVGSRPSLRKSMSHNDVLTTLSGGDTVQPLASFLHDPATLTQSNLRSGSRAIGSCITEYSIAEAFKSIGSKRLHTNSNSLYTASSSSGSSSSSAMSPHDSSKSLDQDCMMTDSKQADDTSSYQHNTTSSSAPLFTTVNQHSTNLLSRSSLLPPLKAIPPFNGCTSKGSNDNSVSPSHNTSNTTHDKSTTYSGHIPAHTIHSEPSIHDCGYTQRFVGAANIATDLKEAIFFGQHSEYIASGSDDGHLFIWDRCSGEVLMSRLADADVLTCVQAHPSLPVLITSGLDDVVRVWGPKRLLGQFGHNYDELKVFTRQLMSTEERQVLIDRMNEGENRSHRTSSKDSDDTSDSSSDSESGDEERDQHTSDNSNQRSSSEDQSSSSDHTMKGINSSHNMQQQQQEQGQQGTGRRRNQHSYADSTESSSLDCPQKKGARFDDKYQSNSDSSGSDSTRTTDAHRNDTPTLNSHDKMSTISRSLSESDDQNSDSGTADSSSDSDLHNKRDVQITYPSNNSIIHAPISSSGQPLTDLQQSSQPINTVTSSNNSKNSNATNNKTKSSLASNRTSISHPIQPTYKKPSRHSDKYLLTQATHRSFLTLKEHIALEKIVSDNQKLMQFGPMPLLYHQMVNNLSWDAAAGAPEEEGEGQSGCTPF